jgi:outer membrane protein with beta-barrel domain
MKFRIALLALAACCISSLALAQIRTGTFEITPFGGYLFGGTFPNGSTAIFNNDVDVKDNGTYGLLLGYNFNSKFEIELQASRTKTDFVRDIPNNNGLFGGSTSVKVGDLDIDYYLADFVFNFGHRHWVPYFSMGAGAARLNPSVPLVPTSSEYRATVTFGTGIKVFVDPHFGFRFGGNYYGTSLPDDHNDNNCDHSHDHCHNHNSNWLNQGDVIGGLTFAF